MDARQYDLAVQIMEDQGIQKIHLLTNNPLKIEAIENSNKIKVVSREPLIIEPKEGNHSYLRTKREVMGHMLNI